MRARKLAAHGAELVAVDLDDEASLLRAFDGAFVVTDYRQPDAAESPSSQRRCRELDQGHDAARAAKAAGLKYAI